MSNQPRKHRASPNPIPLRAGLILSLSIVLGLSGCATSPTGRTQVALFPEARMAAMGTEAFREMRNAQKVETKVAVNDYVRCIVNAITKEVKGSRVNWEVVVFRDDSPNAFALPGGKMGVHTGMLKVAQNQSQLAAVLGHEVGHVLANHSNERASQQQLTAIGLQAVAGSGAVSAPWMQALGLGAQVGLLLPYSRIHESEADIIGLDLMARAGFDPRQSVELWRNMAKSGGRSPPQFLSTHPANRTRIAGLQSRMNGATKTYDAAQARGKKPRCSPP